MTAVYFLLIMLSILWKAIILVAVMLLFLWLYHCGTEARKRYQNK